MANHKMAFCGTALNEMIEAVLAMFPDNPYQVIFRVHERREELTHYVMNRIAKQMGFNDNQSLALREFFSTSDSRLRLQSLVCEGIHHVAEQHPYYTENSSDTVL
jgi:hypothetical protein